MTYIADFVHDRMQESFQPVSSNGFALVFFALCQRHIILLHFILLFLFGKCWYQRYSLKWQRGDSFSGCGLSASRSSLVEARVESDGCPDRWGGDFGSSYAFIHPWQSQALCPPQRTLRAARRVVPGTLRYESVLHPDFFCIIFKPGDFHWASVRGRETGLFAFPEETTEICPQGSTVYLLKRKLWE